MARRCFTWEEVAAATPRPRDMERYLPTLWTLRDDHLYRRVSNVPGAGKGLFSQTPIRAGQVVTWYSGALVDFETYEAMADTDADIHDYAVRLLDERFVRLGNYQWDDDTNALVPVPYADLEAVFTGQGAAQFANSASPGAANANAHLLELKDRNHWPRMDGVASDSEMYFENLEYINPSLKGVEVLLVALCDIATGEEILLDYGEEYFRADDPMVGYGTIMSTAARFAKGAAANTRFGRRTPPQPLLACATCFTVPPQFWQCTRTLKLYCSVECQGQGQK